MNQGMVFKSFQVNGFVHLGQTIKSLWKRLLLIGLALFCFEMLFVLVGSSARVQSELVRDMKDKPEIGQKIMGDEFMEAVLRYGLITISYIHPFIFALFILYSVMVFGQVTVSEISSGTIGFILSRPVSRLRIFANAVITAILGLAFLALATFLATALGIVFLYDSKLSISPFVSLDWNLFLVMLFAAGYVAIFAAVSDSGKKFFTFSGVALFFFYLVDLAGNLWNPLKIISPVNPFSYYEPMKLLTGVRLGFSQSLTILAVCAAMFAGAALVFNRRDLPAG